MLRLVSNNPDPRPDILGKRPVRYLPDAWSAGPYIIRVDRFGAFWVSRPMSIFGAQRLNGAGAPRARDFLLVQGYDLPHTREYLKLVKEPTR